VSVNIGVIELTKIVAFIPIKLNSERFPGKNIRKFTNGDPLLFYILRSLLKSIYVKDVYVYCSDEAVREYLPKGVKFLKREVSLDSNSTKINEVMSSFKNDVNADYYVLAHATAPFIKPGTIDCAIKSVVEDGYDSAFTVEKRQEFLWWANKSSNYNPQSIPRTQDLEPFFIETTGLYVYSKNLIEKGRRIGNNPRLIEVDKIESIDINEPIDFLVADALLQNGMVI